MSDMMWRPGNNSGASRPKPPPEDRQVKLANVIAALALVASVALSSAALLVSCESLDEQTSINAEQREINAEQLQVIEDSRKDAKSEYAIRVAWWDTATELIIQNRSLVPINYVVLRYRATFANSDKSEEALVPLGEGPFFAFSGIAPCAIITMDQRAVEDFYLGPLGERPNSSGISHVYWERLEFTDVHGRWSVTSGGGPESIAPLDWAGLDLEGALLLSDLTGFNVESRDWDGQSIVEESASDCGSG
jgi:hypothetical protein